MVSKTSSAPPSLENISVTDGGKGVSPDPFAWLEAKGAKSAEWEQTQTHRTIEALHGTKNVDAMLRRAQAYRAAKQPPQQVIVRKDVSFWTERGEGDAMALYRRDGEGKPVVLFRTDGGPSHRTAINFFSPSPSSKYIALGLTDGGSEETLVRVLDARTGTDQGDRSADVRLHQLEWLPDESGYLYMRGRGRKDVPPADHNRELNVALHLLGKGDDVEVAGTRVPGKATHASFEYCYPSISTDGKYVVLAVRHGLNPDLRILAKLRAQLLDFESPWEQLYDLEDHVTANSVGDDRLVVVRASEQSGATVEEIKLGSKGRRAIHASPLPLDEVVAVGPTTYAVETNIATKRLLAIAPSGDVTRVALPPGRSVSTDTLRADPRGQQLAVELRAWTELPTWWSISQGGARVRPVGANSGATPGDAFTVHTLEIPARDGETVPLAVVAPKNAATPPRFVWATTYGAYGFVVGPNFTIVRRIFLELGGTFVFAHVRGGGEKGRTWHEQGRGLHKMKTVEDFVDVLKNLRGQGWGKDGGIVAFGSSGGAIPVGGVLEREPQLVDAVAIEGGANNISHLEGSSSVGALHAEEFGDPATEEGARNLQQIDVYLNVRDGVEYPATLLMAGVEDVRVPHWQSTKLAARLERAQAGSRPIFLRLTGGGHVSGNTADEQASLDAELLAFALANIHHPDFR